MKNNRKLIALLCVLAILFTTVFGCLTTLTSAEKPATVQYNLFDDNSTVTGLGPEFSIKTEADGNKLLHFEVSSAKWNSSFVKFNNIILAESKTYKISFEMKNASQQATRSQLFVGVDANILNTEVSHAANGIYTKYEYTVTVPGTLSGDARYLAIRFKANEGAVNCDIDDIIVTEVVEGATTGNVIVDDGKGYKLVPDVSAYDVFAPETVPEGYVYGGWFSDRGCTQSYSGTVAANTTLMLYKKFSIATQSCDFEGDNDYYKAGYPVTTEEEDGNHFLRFATKGNYQLANMRFNNITVEPDSTYVLSFKYRKPDSATINHGMRIGAYRGINTWEFWFMKTTESMHELNLYGESTDINGYRNTGFQLEKATEWTDFSVEIETENIPNATAKYLGFITQTNLANFVIDIDDVALTLQAPPPETMWFQTYTGRNDLKLGGYDYFNVGKVNGNEAVMVNVPANNSGVFPVNGLPLKDNTSYNLTFETLDFENGFNFKVMANGADLTTVTAIAKDNKKQSFSFTTGTGIAGKLVEFYIGAGDSTARGFIDDVILTEVVPEATVGHIIVNDSGDLKVKRNVDKYVTAAPKNSPAETAFCGWHTERSCVNAFNGIVPANTTLMLYPKLTTVIDKIQYEDFEGVNPVEISSGYADFASLLDSNGDHYFNYNEKKVESYSNGFFPFNNLHLKANTTYELKFNYKSVASFQFDIYAENKSITTGVKNLTATEGIEEAKFIVSTPATLTFGSRLAFYCGVQTQSSNAQFYEVTLTEVCDETGFGSIVVHKNNSTADEVVAGKIGEAVSVKVPTAPSGKKFDCWCTDSQLTNIFDGLFAKGQIDIYAKFIDKNMDDQIEDFQLDGDNIKIIGDTASGDFEIKTDSAGNRYYYMRDKKSGENYPQFGARFNNIELKPDTTYMISFDYQYSGPAKILHGIVLDAGSNRDAWDFYMSDYKNGFFEKNLLGTATNQKGYRTTEINQLTNTGSNMWSSYSVIIKTGKIVDDTYKYLTFWLQGVNNQETMLALDNVRATVLTNADLNALLRNADLKKDKTFWSDTANIATVESEGTKKVLHIKGGMMNVFQQMITLQKNTSYDISFSYKGKFSGIPSWAITKDAANTAAANVLYKRTFENADNWTKFSITVNTGDYESLFFLFQSDSNCDYYIKDMKIAKSFKQAEPQEIGVTPLLNSGFKRSIYDGTEKCFAYICDDADNAVKDHSFEGGDDANWKSILTTSNGKITLDTSGENALTGKNALKYQCYDKTSKEKNIMVFNVEPNKLYYLTMFVKAEHRTKEKINCLNITFVDPNTGKELSYSTEYNSYDIRTVVTDGEYHMQRMFFTSGTNTNIGIAFYGATTAYIDDMYLFDAGNAKAYKFVKRDVEGGNLTVTSALLGCDDSDNLILNRNCSKANDFWTSVARYPSDSKVWTPDKYNKSVWVESSNSSRGMALHYVATTGYTGYAKRGYFMKWIEVEPNTDYTFSTDYCAVVPGAGSVGVVTGSDYYPRIISQIAFDGDAAKQGTWNTDGFSFNTGEFTKVGVFILDNGGEAWVDNVRLFKSSDATEIVNGDESGIPTKISSSSLTVDSKNHVLYGIKDGMTVRQIVDKLDNSEYIRVYKDGVVVDDYSKPFTYDMVVALVDGPAINDKVTLALWGDANHDRAFDTKDPEFVLKVLVKSSSLDAYGQYAADVSAKSNGVTISEAVNMYEKINGIGAE